MVACGELLFLSLPALASTISIEMAGLNVSYDGTDIKTVGGVDPLTAVTFEQDSVAAGPVLTTSIAPTCWSLAYLILIRTGIVSPAVRGAS